MTDRPADRNDAPTFECKCCGLCCKRDPYYAVSLLDIHNISQGLGLSPKDFFIRYCDVVMTPGGFRYSAILAPEGCPFVKNGLCAIHFFKPIGCWVFPESSLLPVTELKRHVNAIPTCGILEMDDDERPLKADYTLLAVREIHFECTKAYFEAHEDFDEPSWRESTEHLRSKLAHAKDIAGRAEALRQRAKFAMDKLL